MLTLIQAYGGFSNQPIEFFWPIYYKTYFPQVRMYLEVPGLVQMQVGMQMIQ